MTTHATLDLLGKYRRVFAAAWQARRQMTPPKRGALERERGHEGEGDDALLAVVGGEAVEERRGDARACAAAALGKKLTLVALGVAAGQLGRQ